MMGTEWYLVAGVYGISPLLVLIRIAFGILHHAIHLVTARRCGGSVPPLSELICLLRFRHVKLKHDRYFSNHSSGRWQRPDWIMPKFQWLTASRGLLPGHRAAYHSF